MTNLTLDQIMEACRNVVPTAKLIAPVERHNKTVSILSAQDRKATANREAAISRTQKTTEETDLSKVMGYGSGRYMGD